jgi:hypothetical protein
VHHVAAAAVRRPPAGTQVYGPASRRGGASRARRVSALADRVGSVIREFELMTRFWMGWTAVPKTDAVR